MVPGLGSRWQVFVGPFRVRVTGTRFDVAWRPEEERFSLTLREGSVLVSGPVIGTERVLRAGERLSLARVGGVLTELKNPAQQETEPEPRAVLLEPAQQPKPAVSMSPLPAPPRSLGSAARARPPAHEFLALAAESRFHDALAAAERAGFERLCRTATRDDVLLLADVARLAAAPQRARLAYSAIRERFSGRDQGQAAFFLGRLAFEHDADFAEAARLFELSIAESPAGPLAREAAGRLIEARVRLADEAGARDAARRYLARYPAGPHASAARALVGKR